MLEIHSGIHERDKKKLSEHAVTDESTPIRQWMCWIRFYFHLNPDVMTEDEIVERWAELRYCLKSLGKIE